MRRIVIRALPLPILYFVTLVAFRSPAIDTHTALSFALAVPLIWLSLTDFDRFEIPDLATTIVALVAGLDLVLTQPDALVPHFVAAVMLSTSLWLFGAFFFYRTGTEGLGIGDAKLFGAVTLLLGPERLPELFLLSSLGGIIAYVLDRRAAAQSPGVPFGPFIAYSAYLLSFFDPLFL